MNPFAYAFRHVLLPVENIGRLASSFQTDYRRGWHPQSMQKKLDTLPIMFCSQALGVIKFRERNYADMESLTKTLTDHYQSLGSIGIIIVILSIFVLFVVQEYVRNYFKHKNDINLENHRFNLAKKEKEVKQPIPSEGKKVRLKIDAVMQVSNGMDGHPINLARIILKITVVNRGERIVRIKKVAVIGEATTLFLNGNRKMPLVSSESEFVAYQKEPVVEISPDDGIHIWQIFLPKRPNYLVHEKDGEKYGKGFVELTSEEKHDFEFLLLPNSTWDFSGVQPSSVVQPECVGEFALPTARKVSASFPFIVEMATEKLANLAITSF